MLAVAPEADLIAVDTDVTALRLGLSQILRQEARTTAADQ
jgi:hypothetical protein